MSARRSYHAFARKWLVGVFLLPAALLAAIPTAFAQGGPSAFAQTGSSAFAAGSDAAGADQPPLYSISSRYAANGRASTAAQPAAPTYSAPSVRAVPSWRGINWKPPADSVFGGADYLLLRTHFSEAIAYVQATDSVVNGLPNASVQSREINFPYSSAFRTYVGYNFTPSSALQFTYFHLNDSASINATPGAPNQYFVDAYTGRTNFGDSISSNSYVRLNVFDLDWMGRYAVGDGRLTLRPAAGARWADVRQHNDTSVISPTGGIIDTGTFNNHFTGFGPHFSMLGQYRLRPNSRFALMARGAGSLLVGGFNNTTDVAFTGVANAQQLTHRTLTVPVLEAEIGGSWQATDNLMFSAGWLWQAWFDMGVSGGTTYSGNFAESDSASIMSFDGLFLRGMFRY